MKIMKDEFLRVLEMVQWGVAQKMTVSLSKSFIFQKGKVFSFNDEVLAKATSGLDKSITGAVDAKSLLEIVKELPDLQLEVESTENELIIYGDERRRRSYHKIEKIDDQELPSDQVEIPGEWFELPKDGTFGEAIDMAQNCAEEDNNILPRMCVRLTKKYIEAYDGFQVIRYRIRLGIKTDSILLKKKAVKQIANMAMTHFSETENWVHFKNSTGLTYSCRRWLEDYPSLSDLLKTTGESFTLPAALGDAIERAQIFSKELADANRVKVEVKKNKITVTGPGINGRFEEDREISHYNGEDQAFLISPKLLIDISKKHRESELSKGWLVVRGPKEEIEVKKEKGSKETKVVSVDRWTYLAYLTSPDDIDEELLSKESEEDLSEPDETVED